MDKGDFLYSRFISALSHEPTPCQDRLLHEISDFIAGDDGDIMVVNGYAGTGKTTAISAVIGPLKDLGCKCVLMAPTGRAAKVLSGYAGQHEPAVTFMQESCHACRRAYHAHAAYAHLGIGVRRAEAFGFGLRGEEYDRLHSRTCVSVLPRLRAPRP